MPQLPVQLFKCHSVFVVTKSVKLRYYNNWNQNS